MQSGLFYKAVGVVNGKRTWPDRETRVPVFGVDIGWMGGSEFFRVTPEQYAQIPDAKGTAIVVEGTLEISKFGPRFSVDSIKAVAATEQKPKAATA